MRFLELFQYDWKTPYSTSFSDILDENGKCIGKIRKKYDNSFIRLIDLFFAGKYFVQYEILDSKDQLVFDAKANTSAFKKRQYSIEYINSNNEKVNFQVIDKKMFDIVEKTDFNINGQKYNLVKVPLEWAKLSIGENLIAEWHVPIKPPFKCKLKLYDESYKDDTLLIIGIFHTYLNII